LREIAAGRFREDLFYRLNVVTLHVPPLRERIEDIPLLAQDFLIRFTEKNRKQIRGFTPQAMDRLLRHSWPGNVRELMNAVERGVVLSRGDYLDEAELALLFPERSPAAEPPSSLETVERGTILHTLETADGNKSEAARRLGISRTRLLRLLAPLGEQADVAEQDV